jgi:hypothetical protein
MARVRYLESGGRLKFELKFEFKIGFQLEGFFEVFYGYVKLNYYKKEIGIVMKVHINFW